MVPVSCEVASAYTRDPNRDAGEGRELVGERRQDMDMDMDMGIHHGRGLHYGPNKRSWGKENKNKQEISVNLAGLPKDPTCPPVWPFG